MGGLFSHHHHNSSSSSKKNPKNAVNEVDKAVLDLKVARDRLQRYQQTLERDSEQLVVRAKWAKEQGKTKTALHLLKIRRFKEKEVESVQQQLLNVLQMVQTVDSQQHQAAMLQALKSGKDALHQLHQEQTVDDILQLMDEIQEENEVEEQVNDILRQGVSTLSAQDEADVEAELQALVVATTTTTTTTTTPSTKVVEDETMPELPAVPTNKLPEPATVVVATTSAATNRVSERMAVAS